MQVPKQENLNRDYGHVLVIYDSETENKFFFSHRHFIRINEINT